MTSGAHKLKRLESVPCLREHYITLVMLIKDVEIKLVPAVIAGLLSLSFLMVVPCELLTHE